MQFTDGTSGRYDLIVGADGAGSKIPGHPIRHREAPRIHRPGGLARDSAAAAGGAGALFVLRPAQQGRVQSGLERDDVYLSRENLPTFVRISDDELPEVMREQLADFGGVIGALRETIVDPNEIVYRPVASQLLPQPWHRGRAILIGDAAHTTTPHMAAGAGIAVEDSIVLAELLQSEESLTTAMEKFMARRFERCRLVVDNSRMLGEWEKAPDMPGADPAGVLERNPQGAGATVLKARHHETAPGVRLLGYAPSALNHPTRPSAAPPGSASPRPALAQSAGPAMVPSSQPCGSMSSVVGMPKARPMLLSSWKLFAVPSA